MYLYAKLRIGPMVKFGKEHGKNTGCKIIIMIIIIIIIIASGDDDGG